MARGYEVLYILDPTLTDEQVDEQIGRFKQFVEDRGGTVDNAARWERRRLAYEIKGHREGQYVLMTFKGERNMPSDLDRAFRLADPVLRAQIIRPDIT